MIQKSTLLPVLILISLSILTACTGDRIDTVQATNISHEVATASSTIGVTTQKVITKNVSYATPGGNVDIVFSFTTGVDGYITQLSAVSDTRDHDSTRYISRFNRAATSSIVGKKLADVTSLSAIGGASLTTDAFMSVIR